MDDVLLTIEALDGSNHPVTLRFSENGYIDAACNLYAKRIVGSPMINVSPNDGGVFSVFSDRSIGDVELANRDGGLDTLADYALDGRAAVLSYYNGATVSGRDDRDGVLVIHLRARQEALNDNHPANTYAGDNLAPNGLEGNAYDIKGNNKPVVRGDCRNVPAVLVNEQLLIYQASDRADCLITAVYDEGIRLILWRTDGAHAQGATAITLINGEGGSIPAGAKIVFANHDTVYTVQMGLSGNTVVLASGLTQPVNGNVAVEVVNFFADANALQAYAYMVNGNHDAGATTIALVGGAAAINAGDTIYFAGHLKIYTVQTGLSGGAIVLTAPISDSVDDGEIMQIAGASTPVLWGSYQGYFRLTSNPAGAVTCDCMSVDANDNPHRAGDVMAAILSDIGYTLADSSIFNAVGKLGLFFREAVTTKELLNRITKSVGGIYWFDGTTCHTALLDAPAATAEWTIHDYQIISIERLALGMGNNGVPIASMAVAYDRIETVQPTVDGHTSAGWRQRLKSQYRNKSFSSATVAARHPLALLLNIESLLRNLADVISAFGRLFDLAKTRRDSLSVIVPITVAPLSYGIGSTGNITTPKLGYANGRKMVLVGYEIDDNRRQVTLRLLG